MTFLSKEKILYNYIYLSDLVFISLSLKNAKHIQYSHHRIHSSIIMFPFWTSLNLISIPFCYSLFGAEYYIAFFIINGLITWVFEFYLDKEHDKLMLDKKYLKQRNNYFKEFQKTRKGWKYRFFNEYMLLFSYSLFFLSILPLIH
ncbi:hypothetical protein PEPS_43920 (plasmid) [Persicobacter psychrovividus]|uniref:Fatty acid hydroxylase domain-containing protein n=1 Tax=Persicobacter psychrovividus TaxID=387638 RepID=A0ABN6LKY9_9BACT|nr:hypothetical protein PEPS_43920 [Persicobacter psychrovividus]